MGKVEAQQLKGGLVSAILVCSVILVRGDSWTVETFAKDVCDAVASASGTVCDCVDMHVVPGEGNDLCGYSSALGNGINLKSSTFDKWTSEPLGDPAIGIALEEKCDARSSSAPLLCSSRAKQELEYDTETTLELSLGVEISLDKCLLPVGGSISFSVSSKQSTKKTTTLQVDSTCGPGGDGQPAGTCNIYSQQSYTYNLAGGVGFSYIAIASGGIQMHFRDPVDAEGEVGINGDGSKHYYWWLTIAAIVNYGQSKNIANAKLFEPASLKDGSITFHGSGIASQQIKALSDCHTVVC